MTKIVFSLDGGPGISERLLPQKVRDLTWRSLAELLGEPQDPDLGPAELLREAVMVPARGWP